MKRSKYILLTAVFVISLLSLTISVNAQEPPHPPTTGHGAKGNQSPPGAPLDGGIGILLALGLAYSTRKSKRLNDKGNSM
jgi:hypothetical protein